MSRSNSYLLHEVTQAVIESGQCILSLQGKDLVIHTKADQSPVSEADLLAETILKKKLIELLPDVPIISEEGDAPEYSLRQTWNAFWLIDPLDGTKEFLKGLPEFTVNVALIENGIPTLGVVYAPGLGVLYRAAKGLGSWKSQDLIHFEKVLAHNSNEHQKVLVESRHHYSKKIEDFVAKHQIQSRIQVGSSIKFCYLAEGKADVYARFTPINEWDIAAGDCIYRYASEDLPNPSPFHYNSQTLKIDSFVVGSSSLGG